MARLLIPLIFVGVLTGCSERYLTLEGDQMMRETCEPAGCVVIPNPEFEAIIRAMGVEA